jgi:hypothetical protein
MGTGASSMHNAFRNALVIEAMDLLAGYWVFQKRRTGP